MTLATIDWVLICVYFAFSVAIALFFSKSSGKSLGDFFLGGRKLPWYIAGISMVATTFAADTPLAVTEIVAQNGISGNWLWWNMLIGGMLTTFFFAKLWRRANVLTEVEFISLRYSGKPAKALRGFKAVYLGGLMNILVMGWVNLALISLLRQFFHLSEADAFWYTAAAMCLVAVYSSIGGFMSVAFTDMFQFLIAMTGSIVLAVLVLNSEQIGGVEGLKEKLGTDNPIWNFIPSIGETGGTGQLFTITFATFFAHIGLQWWASWYPGAEPGGGGYVAQRMMSARSERDSVLATLFFQIAHYCLRPWPWIIVALCSVVLYPDLAPEDAKLGYVNVMRDFLPDGFRGLMLVAFLAAYMSTISTQLNWGASYVVNDLLLPLESEKKGKLDNEGEAGKNLVGASRIITVLLMILAMAVTSFITSISGVWSFMVECGAGLGLVLILRWFWWRINVWSEIAATAAPFVFYAIAKFLLPADSFLAQFPNSYFFTIGGTTITWLVVTYLTPAEPMEKLVAFHQRVRPGGIWSPVAERSGVVVKSNTFALVVAWLSAVVMTYSALFAMGNFLFHDYGNAWLSLGLAVASGICMVMMIWIFDLFSNKSQA